MTPVAIGDIQRTQGTRKTCIMPKNRYRHLLLCLHRYGFFSFVLSLILTVCELFFTKEVPCFPLQDIFISGEVLVLAFLFDPSNLWLDIFCSRYGFFSFVVFDFNCL